MQNRRQFLVADVAIERFVSFDLLYLYLHRRILAAAGNSLLAVCWKESEIRTNFPVRMGSFSMGNHSLQNGTTNPSLKCFYALAKFSPYLVVHCTDRPMLSTISLTNR